jgi:D-alanine-D-alanine ligase
MTDRPYRNVGVLMGGPSAEREVSLRSGAAVAAGLRTAGYEAVEIDVTTNDVSIPPGVEAVFIALHGRFGEDGTVQALLRDRGIPYTGSGPDASRLAFDKVVSKRIFFEEKIPTPPWEVLTRNQAYTLPLPFVVKPARQGSSIGIHIVRSGAEWTAAFLDALSYDDQVMVESFIEGRELTVGVVGDEVLPILEIRAPAGFYSYDAKYTRGRTEYLVPAPVRPDEAAKCRDAAWRTFQALGCSGMGRVDLRLSPGGEPYVLELNSIPGFTETSLLPKAARAAGIEFPALCDRILRMASVH